LGPGQSLAGDPTLRATGISLPVALVLFAPVSHATPPLSARASVPGLTTTVRV